MRMDCGQMGALWGGAWCSGQTGAAAAGTEGSVPSPGQLELVGSLGGRPWFRSVPAVGPVSACSQVAVWAGHEITGCSHMLWEQELCEGRGPSERGECGFSCR